MWIKRLGISPNDKTRAVVGVHGFGRKMVLVGQNGVLVLHNVYSLAGIGIGVLGFIVLFVYIYIGLFLVG
jgi:hypothetical protein